MSDQLTNMSAAAEQSQVHMVETALPSSTPPSDKVLGRITILLLIPEVGVEKPTYRYLRIRMSPICDYFRIARSGSGTLFMERFFDIARKHKNGIQKVLG
jgi:hypothetical protein